MKVQMSMEAHAALLDVLREARAALLNERLSIMEREAVVRVIEGALTMMHGRVKP